MSIGGQKKVAILGASGYTGAELMRWNKFSMSSRRIQTYMAVHTNVHSLYWSMTVITRWTLPVKDACDDII